MYIWLRPLWCHQQATHFSVVFAAISAINFDGKSISKRVLKQSVPEQVRAKIEIKEHCQRRHTSQTTFLLSAVNIESASQFSFLPSKPCFFPLRPSFEFMVHQGKPTISNLVFSPPMNQTLVSATLVDEPELSLHVKLPPPFFGCCCLTTKQDNETRND